MKKNEKTEEYNYSGKVLFEGEYKNGRRWNRKEYNSNCVVIYEVGFSYMDMMEKGNNITIMGRYYSKVYI